MFEFIALADDFNPRSPRGLRPCATRYFTSSLSFQSTQPKRAATCACQQCGRRSIISIHAAQEGCDFIKQHFIKRLQIFQSTQPKRAATLERIKQPFFYTCYFNPRSPRGLRQKNLAEKLEIYISIHAAQEGCDSIRINCNYYSFYSYKSAKLTFLLN